MKKKLCYLLLFALLVTCVSALVITAGAETDANYGVSFTADNPLTISGDVEVEPYTLSATVYLPTSYSARAGAVIGNYSGASGRSYTLEVSTNGAPRLFMQATANKAVNLIFTELDIRGDEPRRISIVMDKETPGATCYVSDLKGNLIGKQTLTSTVAYPTFTVDKLYMIGGDYRSGNSQYFKGQILETAIYADQRTEAECIASTINTEDTDMIFGHDLTKPSPLYTNDLSGNWHSLTAADEIGMTFDANVRQLSKKLSTLPKTIETWVNVPDVDRPGIFFGQYKDTNCFNFEIGAKGAIKLYFKNASGTVENLIFKDGDGNNLVINNTGWVHFAVVIEESQILLYQNGEVVSTMPYTNGFSLDPLKYNFVLGGDLRANNSQYFKGRMLNLAAYTDARTADEIKADMNAVDPNAQGLMLYYDLSNVKTEDTTIPDLGPNGYNITPPPQTWYQSSPNALKDYAYSMAVVGDTQQLTEQDAANGTNHTAQIYDWIAANVQSKNIQLVLGLGDITQTDIDEEWTVAKTQISKLDGIVPYTLVKGAAPHDRQANFNKYFGTGNYYASQVDGTYLADRYENAYMKLTIGQTKYLIVMLDFGPTDDILTWAGNIISSNPDHKVIITTHAFIHTDGEPYDENDSAVAHGPGVNNGKNNGDEMWDELIKLYPNIVMVLSGHFTNDDIVCSQVQGVHGNTITQMLINPQSMDPTYNYETGMVAMLYFSEDGSEIQVEYISTERANKGEAAYFKTENQFNVDLYAEVEPPAEPNPDAFNTPYGVIPDKYDVETYPFAIFVVDETSETGYKFSKVTKSLLTDDTLEVKATGSAFNMLRPDQNAAANSGSVIFMRRDFTYSHSDEVYSNFTYNVSEFTLDLGGHVFYDEHSSSGGIFYWYLKAKPTVTSFTFTVKNGDIVIGHNPIVTYNYNGNNGTNNITTIFKNVDFRFMEGATAKSVFGPMYTSSQDPNIATHTFAIAMNGCTVDYTNAPKGVDLLADGSSVKSTLTTSNCEFINRGNVTPKISITMANGFILNLYIPVVTADVLDTVTGIKLGGAVYSVDGAPTVTIDGASYRHVQMAITPDALGEILSLSVDVNHVYTYSDKSTASKVINSTLAVDIIAYLSDLAKDTDANTATLGKDALYYVRAAYDFAGGSTEIIAKINGIIGEGYGTSNKPTDMEKKEVTDGMASAGLSLDEAPAFIFYPELDGEGNPVYSLENYQFAIDGKYRLNAEIRTDESGKQYFYVSTYAYAMVGTVEYLVKGTDIHGYYNVKAYYDFASGYGDAKLVTLVEALWKYAESAKAYREAK